jgi:hypothetical protein
MRFTPQRTGFAKKGRVKKETSGTRLEDKVIRFVRSNVARSAGFSLALGNP